LTEPLREGAEVTTPRGRGIVLYVRMAPPDYTQIAAVSVYLEREEHRPDYAGTIFSVEQVTRTE
jgi:hypothetical protein